MDYRGLDYEGTNINSLKNNNINTNNNNNPSVSLSTEEDKQTDGLEQILQVLKNDYIKQSGIRQEFLRSIEGVITQMYFSNYLKIDGATIPQKIARKVLSQLTPFCIEHTHQKFDEYTRLNEVKNPKKYLQTILYNSVYDEEISITTTVNYNVFGNGRKSAVGD